MIRVTASIRDTPAQAAQSAVVLAGAVGLLLLATPALEPVQSTVVRFYSVLGALALVALMPLIWSRNGWPFISWGTLVTIGILGLASIIVDPVFQVTGLGAEFYAPFSESLDFSGPLGNRVLTPLLARATFLHGDRFYLLIYAETFLLILLVLRFFDQNIKTGRTSTRRLIAISGTAVVALSSIVYGQLTDPSNVHVTSYVLILGFLLIARKGTERAWVKVGLYGLLAANRLTSVFIFPFLFLYAARELKPRNLLTEAMFAVPALVFLVVMKLTLGSVFADLPDGISQLEDIKNNVVRTTSFLFSADAYQVVLYPFALSFALSWLLVGWFLYKMARGRAYYAMALAASAAFFPLVQIFLATGWGRYMGIAFPALMISTVGLADHKLGRRLVLGCAILGPVGWFLYVEFYNLQWLAPGA